ncbi:unnamed protein product, partial [Mesorhabditis belari]|uniref:Uncharacterized protein n=1 Tax=Mesorhabditis belari TaxID=2138241 RepID=A0AAF3EF22_9BILA
MKQYIDAITAYGPGLGVYTPYSYVDISYDNLPGIGKIPLLGKEGTASRLGISPFYPLNGNPGNPLPPLYKARPLPPNIPEPADVVAVPLDEEALHGEPLFPPELTLPGEPDGFTSATSESLKESGNEIEKPPINPFGDIKVTGLPPDGVEVKDNLRDGDVTIGMKNDVKKDISGDTLFFEDSAIENNIDAQNMNEKLKTYRSPFAEVIRRKRIKRMIRLMH